MIDEIEIDFGSDDESPAKLNAAVGLIEPLK